MTRIDRRALFASGAAAALLAATGVSAMPRRGGVLRIALSGCDHESSWEMPGSGRFMQVVRQGAVLDSLTEIAADGALRGELATEWESDSNDRLWRFALREGVQFHDGQALRPADVVAALTEQGLAAHPDDHAVIIALDEPDRNLPLRLAGPDFVIPPAEEARRSAGIGTGLYRVRACAPGRNFIGERVQSHWKDGMAGWMDRIEIAAIPSEQVRAQALLEGLVDAAELSDRDPAMRDAAFVALPSSGPTRQVVRAGVGLPSRIGTHWPLDNLRIAERWWVA